MHLSVRASEKRLASAPERAVPSHGHIDHELNLRRSLSMSQHPVPGCSESAAAACAGTRRHPSALMPTELALCGADARVSLAPAQPPPPAGLASTSLVLFYATSILLNFCRCDGGTPWPSASTMCVRKTSKGKTKLPWIMIPASTKAVSCDHALAIEARACDAANSGAPP